MSSKSHFFRGSNLPFIATFRTTSDNESVSLPYISSGVYNGSIDWGDGTVVANSFANKEHIYLVAGDYDVYVNGKIENLTNLTQENFKSTILNIKQWGNTKIDRGEIFRECTILDITAQDVLNTENTNTLVSLFFRANNLTCLNANINNWDTSNVVDMSGMFYQTQINTDIGNWDTSNVSTFQNMFFFATSFNSDIGSWNTESCNTFRGMFINATSFNQDISNWNFSSVNNVNSLFDFMRGKSQANYDANYYDNLLIKWASDESVGGLPIGVVGEIDMGAIKYTSAGASARQSILDNNKATTITDGGQI